MFTPFTDQEATDQSQELEKRNRPIGLLLGGLAVGCIAGVVAPVTALEHRNAVPLRNVFVRRARQAYRKLLGHAYDVLVDTIAEATGSVTTHSREIVADVEEIKNSPEEGKEVPIRRFVS